MKQRGFTLIELLIVIGVIAILSVVVTVNYVNYRKTSQLDVTAQRIVSTLRDAQSRSVAAKDGSKYGVHFQDNIGADDEYMLFQGDSYAGGTVLDTYTVPSILGLTTISFAGSTGTEVVFDELTGSTPNFGYVTVTLTSLAQDKIIAVNSEGQISEVDTAPVFTGIPGSFHLDTPASGTIVTNLIPTFTWDPAANTDSYTLWHSTDPTYATYTEITGITAHPTTPSYTLGAGEELTNNARNYWKVKAIGSNGERWSEEKDWYVNAGINDPPAAFNLVSPDNGATETTTLSPTFDWDDTTDPNGHPLTYTLEYSENNAFPPGQSTSITGISISEYTLKPAEQLPNHATVYWRVIAIDSLGAETVATDAGTGDPYRSLNIAANQAPGSFSLVNPTDGATVSTATPTLDWEDSVDPDTPYTGDTVTYTVWYSTDPSFAQKTEVSGLATSQYTVATALVENEAYYWRVKAQDNHGATTWSNQLDWSFTYTSSGGTCDWHVDQSVAVSGDGTSWATAFKTVGEAVSALSGGDQVCIANGTYNEEVDLNSAHSGTVGDLTEFVNKTGDTSVIIDGSTNVFELNNADYISISGLKLTGATNGLRIRTESTNNVFTGLEFYNLSYGIRILASSSNNNDFYNLTIHDLTNRAVYDQGNNQNLFHDLTIYDITGDYGIYINGGNLHQIYSNEIYNTAHALYFNGDDDSIVHDNNIHDNSDTNYFTRIDGTEVYDNEFEDNTGNWVLYFNRPDNLTVHHNVFSGNTDNIYSTRSDDVTHIYNNTIYGNGSGYGIYLVRFDGVTKLRNNIITNNQNGFTVSNGNANLNNDYADVWGNTNNYSGQGATYAGTNSISADPLFVTPGSDFHLQATSPCIDTGDPDPFYNDPDGSRSDMGAYPYTP